MKNENNVRIKRTGKSSLEWMRRVQSGERLIKVPPSILSNIKLTLKEISKHNKPDDCWIILNVKGGVYDVTEYLEYHPSGVDQIMRAAGKDGTSLFNHYHSFVNYKAMLKNCYLGVVVPDKKDEIKTKKKKHDDVNFEWKKCPHGYTLNVSIQSRKPSVFEDLIVFIEKSHNVILCVKIEERVYQAYLFYCDDALSKLEVIVNSPNTFQIDLTMTTTRSIIDLFSKDNLSMKHSSSIESSPNFLAEKYFIKVTLVSYKLIARNVYHFKIKLDNDFYFSAPLATHVALRMLNSKKFNYFTFVPSELIDNENCSIEYDNYICPQLDSITNSYCVHFTVKDYPNSEVTNQLITLKSGQQLEMSTPIYATSFQPNQLVNKNIIYMCSSGIGIAIMWRLILFIIKHHTHTRIKLLCSFQRTEDIIWKDHLEALTLLKPEIFSFKITLTREPPDSTSWKGSIGRIDTTMLKEFIEVADDSILYVCGSNQFIDDIAELAEEFFHSKSQIIGFKGY